MQAFLVCSHLKEVSKMPPCWLRLLRYGCISTFKLVHIQEIIIWTVFNKTKLAAQFTETCQGLINHSSLKKKVLQLLQWFKMACAAVEEIALNVLCSFPLMKSHRTRYILRTWKCCVPIILLQDVAVIWLPFHTWLMRLSCIWSSLDEHFRRRF